MFQGIAPRPEEEIIFEMKLLDELKGQVIKQTAEDEAAE